MPNNTFIIPKYRVFHVIPWNSDKNIGKSYNETMSLVRSNDWVCFIDGDSVHTSHFFGSRIEEVIESNPSYSLFTCYTNRIGCGYQIAPKVDGKNNDQKYHRDFGENLWNQYKTEVMDITKSGPLSGVMILIRKSEWERVGGFKEEKMLSVDNDIHDKFTKAGLKVGLMKGLYLQHWYRGGDPSDKKHLL
jgi:GT2 family glycosyltransferase